MIRALVTLAVLAHPAVAEPTPHVEVANGLLMRQGIALDLDVAGGLRVHAPDADATRWWFARARAGVLVFSEPSFWSLGVAGQLGPLDSSSLGLELQYVEVFHGASAQLGVFPLDSTGGVTVEAQLGWTVLGVEYQRRLSGPRDGDQVFVLLLHAPLGVIRQMLKDPPGVVHR